MPDRIPVHTEVALNDFDAKLVLPLDLKPDEAHRVKSIIDEATPDPSAAAKYAVCDPNVYPELTDA